MLISAGSSSKDLSLSAASPVRMLSVVGAENSQSDLLAMASNAGVKFWTQIRSSESDELSSWDNDDDGWVFLNLALVFLNNASGLSSSYLEG
jgi:hypothetical protein